MEFEQAQEIVDAWGKHLEYSFGKLNMLFMARIPESFLPFPKDQIEQAVNIIAEHYHKAGNNEAVEKLQTTIGLLGGFEEDEEALLAAANNFNNKKFRDSILPALRELQT